MERRSPRLLIGLALLLLTACGGATPSSRPTTTYDDEAPSGVTVNTTPDPNNEEDSSPNQPDDTGPSDNGDETPENPPDSETPDETPTQDPPDEEENQPPGETDPPDDETTPPDPSTPLALADSCTFGDDSTCGTDQVCSSIFAAPGSSELDTTDSACFASCTITGSLCTTASGMAGTCNAFSSGFLCVAEGDNLGPCGNRMNSACGADAPICLTQPGASVGVCARLCNPEDITTCRALSGLGCGCLDGQACSVSPMGVNEPGGGLDGLCAPPSATGDACGLDTATYLTSVCTSGQNCVTTMTGSNDGTCQAP